MRRKKEPDMNPTGTAPPKTATDTAPPQNATDRGTPKTRKKRSAKKSASPPAAPDVQPADGVLTPVEMLRVLSDVAAARGGFDQDASLKAADRLKALELLGKHYALFTDRTALEGEGLRIRLEGYDGPTESGRKNE